MMSKGRQFEEDRLCQSVDEFAYKEEGGSILDILCIDSKTGVSYDYFQVSKTSDQDQF